MPAKRKARVSVQEDDVNDGSGSDISDEDYIPRAGVQRLHHIHDETISATSRGRIRATVARHAIPASPSKKSEAVLNPDLPPSDDPEPALRSWEPEYSEFDAEYGPGLQSGPRDLRGSVSNTVIFSFYFYWQCSWFFQDDPNEQWARLDRPAFLDEIIRGDGRGDHIDQLLCANDGCNALTPTFRCQNCIHPCLYCHICVVQIHRHMPFHHIQVRTDYLLR